MGDLTVAMAGVEDMFICEATITTGRFCTFASSDMSLLDMEATEVQAEAQGRMAKTAISMFPAAQSSMMLRQANTSAMLPTMGRL